MTDIRDAFVGTFFVPGTDNMDGVDGESPYYVNLSNESHTILVEADGTPITGELARAFTLVSAGTGHIPYAYTSNDTPLANQFSITNILTTGDGWTAAERTTDGGVEITGLTTTAAIGCSVNFRVKFGDGTILNKTFSINKSSKPGAVDLTATINTLMFDGDSNLLSPTDIVFTASLRGTFTPTSYRWSRKYDTGSWTVIDNTNDPGIYNPTTPTGSTVTLAYSNFDTLAELFTTQLLVRVEILDASGDIIDEDDIKVTKTKYGTSAYSVHLTNSNHTIPTDVSGKYAAGDLATATTNISVKKGSQTYTYSNANAGPYTFRVSAISSDSGATGSVNTTTGIVSITAITAEIATLTITVAVYGGATFLLVMSLNKSMGKGTINLTYITDTFTKLSSTSAWDRSNIVITATILNLNSPTYKWQYNAGGTWYDFSTLQTGSTLTLTPDDPVFGSNIWGTSLQCPIRCICNNDTKISDVAPFYKYYEDPIKYYILPTNGTAIKNGVSTLTVKAHKIQNGIDSELSSGTIQMYVGATAKGYSATFGAADINGSILVELKSGSTVLDTITLIDVADGTFVGSITASSLVSSRSKTGVFTPTPITFTPVFYFKGAVVPAANMTWTDPPAATGVAYANHVATITPSTMYNNGLGVTEWTGTWTANYVVGTITYTFSVTETFNIVLQGIDGTTGPVGSAFRFRGLYDDMEEYEYNDYVRDVVRSGTIYYMVASKTVSPVSSVDPPNITYWATFSAQFASVAIENLWAQEATIANWYVATDWLASADRGTIGGIAKGQAIVLNAVKESLYARPLGTGTNTAFVMVGQTYNPGVYTGTNGWSGYYGISAIDGNNNWLFRLDNYAKSIAGWDFDTAKFSKGTTSVGIALNTSATRWIANSGKGFEVWNPSDTRLFAGALDSSGNLSQGFAWNLNDTATYDLKFVIKGDIISSKFSTSSFLTPDEVYTGEYAILDSSRLVLHDYVSEVLQNTTVTSTSFQISVMSGPLSILGLVSMGAYSQTDGGSRILIDLQNVPKCYGVLSNPPNGAIRNGDFYLELGTADLCVWSGSDFIHFASH